MSPGTQAKITGSHERKEDVATTGSSQGNCQQADEAPQAGEENSEQLNNCNMLLASFKSQDLKLNIQKTKIMASSHITSWQTDGETMETVTDSFAGLQNHCRW